MRADDLIAILQSVPGDATVLICKDGRIFEDDGEEMAMMFRLEEAHPCFTHDHELAHMNFDFSVFENGDFSTASPVVVLRDFDAPKLIKRVVQNAVEGDWHYISTPIKK